jgi:hypothetical protein
VQYVFLDISLPLPLTQGKKAKALAVPPPLLAGADEVIEIELQIAAVHESAPGTKSGPVSCR